MRVPLLWMMIGCFPLGMAGAETRETPILDQYLSIYHGGSVRDLPLTEDVTFDGPLLSQTIVGPDAVTDFLNRVVPSLGIESVDILQKLETPDGACAELVFGYTARSPIEYAHCLKIEDGQISAIRLYFDPRPFLNE